MRDAGFTLVELMVVLVITGLMTAAVVTVMPDPRGSVREDGTALAARLAAARDMAIIGGHDVAVRIDTAGYRFAARDGDGWHALADKALAARTWRAGVAARVAIEGDGPLIFDATGLATPAQVVLQRGDAATRVDVNGSGKVRVDAP